MQIGNSLLLSKEFQELTPGAGRLYLCMAMESGGKPETTFTHGTAKKYGIAGTTFDRQVKELCEGGFLERVQDDGLMQYSPGIFRFSLAWKSVKSAPHFGEGKGPNIPQNGEGMSRK